MKILDYINGNRKGKNARNLELEAMQDPFLADAMDGFDSVGGNHAEKIARMQAQISARANTSARKKRLIGYRITAAAVVLVALLSGYFTLMNHRSTMLAAQESQGEVLDIYVPEEYLNKKRAELTQMQEDAKGTEKVKLNAIVKIENLDEVIQPFEPLYVYYPESHYDKFNFDSGNRLLARSEPTNNNRQTVLDESIVDNNDSPMHNIRGKVTDNHGEPLIGAIVSIKGTNIGAVTDMDGFYSIQANLDSPTLIADYIGYEAIEIPKPLENQDIAMNESSQNLSEVVVTGYGSVKKKDLIGSVSSIDSEVLALKSAEPSSSNKLSNALEGKLAGISVQKSQSKADDTKIRVRGSSSAISNNTPLYVVNGIPIADIKDIAPEDIESIEVLKDTAANAIYGSRASNGVVLITLKEGVKPLEGMAAYNRYLDNNKNRPTDTECKDKKGIVRVEFNINKKGQPINIKAVGKLCPSLDKEAIRLVGNGPLWTPEKEKAVIDIEF